MTSFMTDQPANTNGLTVQPPTKLSLWINRLEHSALARGVRTNDEVIATLRATFLAIYDYRLGQGGVSANDYIDALAEYDAALALLLTSGYEAAAITLICAQALLERGGVHVTA